MENINTIWIDVNLGQHQCSDSGEHSYIPKITRRIELTSASRITSSNFMENLNELKYQLMRETKNITTQLSILENEKGYQHI